MTNRDPDFTELLKFLVAEGNHAPIVVAPSPHGKFVVLTGHRRVEAMRCLGMPSDTQVSVRIARKS